MRSYGGKSMHMTRTWKTWMTCCNYSSRQYQCRPIFLENETKHEMRPQYKKRKFKYQVPRFLFFVLRSWQQFLFHNIHDVWYIIIYNNRNINVDGVVEIFQFRKHNVFFVRSKRTTYIFTCKYINAVIITGFITWRFDFPRRLLLTFRNLYMVKFSFFVQKIFLVRRPSFPSWICLSASWVSVLSFDALEYVAKLSLIWFKLFVNICIINRMIYVCLWIRIYLWSSRVCNISSN